MLNETVFVVGAGASKEAGLPTGHELKAKIADLLDIGFDDFGYRLKHGDHKIVEALRYLVNQSDGQNGDINPYLYEAWHIRDALPQAISIDNFIDAHRENEKVSLCGKLAIVRSILDSERESLLRIDPNSVNRTLDFEALSESWYTPFFQLLTENCSKEEAEKRFSSVTLIIFNYDRCIEHFLYYALQNYYNITDKEAAELVSRIKIYHPYGKVGALPWAHSEVAVEFGGATNSEQLLNLARQINTFTEGTDPESSEIIAIRDKVGNSEKLVFIGFAFHRLNIELISPAGINKSGGSQTKCFATTLGISVSDEEVIQGQISNLSRSGIKMESSATTCKNFFSEYWRSLAF